MSESSDPVLAWEFFYHESRELEPELDEADAKQRWNGLSLSERAPFLDRAKQAAEGMLMQAQKVKKKRSAYQFFIAKEHAALAPQYPTLSVAQLTKQHLAPRWQRLTDEEKQQYKTQAAEDAARWEREKAALPKKRKQEMKQAKAAAELPTNAPLSGAGLYVAANWDTSQDGGSAQAAASRILERWIDLPPESQSPWKEQARSNQKAFALSMARRPKGKKEH